MLLLWFRHPCLGALVLMASVIDNGATEAKEFSSSKSTENDNYTLFPILIGALKTTKDVILGAKCRNISNPACPCYNFFSEDYVFVGECCDQGFKMVSECPDAEVADELKKLCEGSVLEYGKNVEDWHSYLVNVPVLSTTTRNFYRNVFCAYCNNVTKAELTTLSLEVACNQDVSSPRDIQMLLLHGIFSNQHMTLSYEDQICALNLKIDEDATRNISKSNKCIMENGAIYLDDDKSKFDDQATNEFEELTNISEDLACQLAGEYLPYGLENKCIPQIAYCENVDFCDEDNTERNYSVNNWKKPFQCKCDSKCSQYGDCCIGAQNVAEYKKNHLKCHRLQEQDLYGVLMISTCQNSSSELKALCDLEGLTSFNHTMDLPAYSVHTDNFYRNRYCAACNGVLEKHLAHLNTTLKCTKNVTMHALKNFIRPVNYCRNLRWSDYEGFDCHLTLEEFQPSFLEKKFPGARSCLPEAVDECPESYENKDVASKCRSYSQHIEEGYRIYKNPHCFLCHSKNLMLSPLKKWNCFRNLQEVFVFRTPPMVALFNFEYKYEPNVMKLCEENEVWDHLREKCTEKITVFPSISDNDFQNADAADKIQYSSGKNLTFENCSLIILSKEDYTNLPDGSIYVNGSDIEGQRINEARKFDEGSYFPYNETEGTLAVCALEISHNNPTYSAAMTLLSDIILALSVAFNFIHMGIFMLLPKLRNLPGKNLFSLTLSLFLAQSLFFFFVHYKNETVCYFIGVVLHYLFLSSFFWMNILSCDIWRTFSSEFMQQSSKSKKLSTFIYYSFYAWVSPAVIVGVAVWFDQFYNSIKNAELSYGLQPLRPLYGRGNFCWIGQGFALLIFFGVPVAIIVMVNAILFTITACKMHRQDRENKNIFDQSTSGDFNGRNRCKAYEFTRAKLYLKLALIMGLSWVLGFISSVFDWDPLWYLFIVFNGLQGVFIFFSFDFKWKIWHMFAEKYAVFESSASSKSDSGNKVSLRTSANGTTTTYIRGSKITLMDNTV